MQVKGIHSRAKEIPIGEGKKVMKANGIKAMVVAITLIEAGTRSPPEYLGSRWPNPKREFLSFRYGRTCDEEQY